ncbi:MULTISPECIES: hypothetical protein [Streptococcus]|uniref:Uncharacterized protein n=1 Tax=Streptococcus caledonicus TaxID=2614158 RepID=A0ABW0UEH4_9STRE|nr:hypothetical protein [Streptococcus sp. S784/96/1]
MKFYKGVGIVFIVAGVFLFGLDLVHGSSSLPVTWIVYVLSGMYLLVRDRLVSSRKWQLMVLGIIILLFGFVILSDLSVLPKSDLSVMEFLIPFILLTTDLDDIEKKVKERKNVKD